MNKNEKRCCDDKPTIEPAKFEDLNKVPELFTDLPIGNRALVLSKWKELNKSDPFNWILYFRKYC